MYKKVLISLHPCQHPCQHLVFSDDDDDDDNCHPNGCVVLSHGGFDSYLPDS